MRSSRSSAGWARSSSTRCRSPAGATTSCCTRASPTRPCLVRAPLRAARGLRGVQQGALVVRTSEFPWFRGTLSVRLAARSSPRTPRWPSRCSSGSVPTGPLSALDFERSGSDDRLVRSADQCRARGARGVRRHRRARPRATRRQPPLLRPPRAAAPRGGARARGSAEEQLRHKLLSRYRAHGLLGVGGRAETSSAGLGPAKPDPRRPDFPDGRHCARSSSRKASSFPSRSTVFAASVSSCATRSSCSRRRRSRRRRSRSSSLRPAGLGPRPPRVLFEFDYVWELFFPPEKRRWGWYVLPISSATASSAGSSRGSTATGAWRCSASGGRTASPRPAPRASSRRCARRFVPPCSCACEQPRVAAAPRPWKRLLGSRP